MLPTLLLIACQDVDRPAPLPVQATAVPTPDPKATVVIGVLHATTGGYAPHGVAINEGVRLALGVEQPVVVAGRKVLARFEDTEGKPDRALALARRLVEHDKASLLIGPATQLELQLIADYLRTQQVPMLVTFGWTPDLASPPADLFQVTGAPLTHRVAGWYAAARAGLRRATLAVSDYPQDWSAREAFRQGFQQAGGAVAAEVALPLGAPNAAAYLEEVRAAAAGSTVLAMPHVAGAAAQQAAQAFGNTPAMVSAAAAVASAAPPSPPHVEGALNYGEWRVSLDSEENRQFAEGIRRAFKKEPTLHHYYGYLAAQVALQALGAAGGATQDPATLATALRGVDFRGPAGRFRFGARGTPIAPVHLWPGEGAPRGMAAATIEDVGVDWRVPN